MVRRFGSVQSSVQILDSDTAAGLNARAGAGDSGEKPWIMLEPVIEPVVLTGKANEDARRTTVTCDNNLLGCCLAEEARQVVFDFGEGDLFHSGIPCCSSHS